MNRIASRFSRHLFQEPNVPERFRRLHLRLFEVVVAGLSVWMAWKWAVYIRGMSQMTSPVGLAAYVDLSGMLGTSIPYALAAAATVLALLGGTRTWRYGYLTMVLLMHVLYVTRFSLGKIQHGTMLLGMMLLGIALAVAWFSSEEERRRFAFGYAYFFGGLSYLLAGICKLIGTGVTWPDGQHLWLWIQEKGIDSLAKFGVVDFNLLQELALADYGVATFMLLGGLLTELAGPALWHRRYRPYFGLAVIGMHVGIFFIMDILFYVNIVVVALVALPWAEWSAALSPTSGAPPLTSDREQQPVTHRETRSSAGT
jgi:hypothetical protein